MRAGDLMIAAGSHFSRGAPSHKPDMPRVCSRSTCVAQLMSRAIRSRGFVDRRANCMSDRVQRLRRDLVGAITPPALPGGYCVRTFVDDDAAVVHRLLEVGYAQGGGQVRSFDEWWPSLRADDGFAADLCFLAINARRDIVGVAQCWTSAFIKDLVVHPLVRRQGIAT